MNIKVVYSTEVLQYKNGSRTGIQCERGFLSIEAAQSALLPEGYSFAYFQIKDGYWVYSKTLGWEFYVTKPQATDRHL